MFLGIESDWTNSDAVSVGGRYCCVVTYNVCSVRCFRRGCCVAVDTIGMGSCAGGSLGNHSSTYCWGLSVDTIGTVVAGAGRTEGLSGCVFDALPFAVVVSDRIDSQLAIISCLSRGRRKCVWLLLCLAVSEKVERRHVKLEVKPVGYEE